MKKAIIIGVIVILILISISTRTAYNSSNSTANNTSTPEPSQSTVIPTPKYEYKILGTVKNKLFDIVSVLVNTGETSGEQIAQEVKKTCQKKCTVDIYDDQKSYDLQNEYTTLMGKPGTQPADLTNWKKKNTIFLADHFIGSLDMDTNSYQAFPFKDWYYKELKGIK